MKINLFNQNVAKACFQICWSFAGDKPSIALDTGDIALFDIDVFSKIPEGSSWWVKCSLLESNVSVRSDRSLKYIKGRGFSGCFDLKQSNTNITLTYRDEYTSTLCIF